MQSMTQALDAIAAERNEIVQEQLFETLFPIGPSSHGTIAVTRLPQHCTTCGKRVNKTTGGFEIDPAVVGRTWKTVRLYDRPECLPPESPARAPWAARDGGWYSWNTRTGEDARELGHPWDLRDTTLWEEAILALDRSARTNEHIIDAVRLAFEAPATLHDPEVGKTIFDLTLLPLPDGTSTTLGAIVAAHREELCMPLLTTGTAGEQTLSMTYRPEDLCGWILDLTARHAA